MGLAIHHTVILVADVDESLHFYRDGLGLDVIHDIHVEGNWPELFGAPGRRLRAVFLGNSTVADVEAGVLELNSFDGYAPRQVSPGDLAAGLLMLSFFVDVEQTLGTLADLGLGGTPQRIVQPTPNGQVTLVTVRDPDGIRVLLTPGSIVQQSRGPGGFTGAIAPLASTPSTPSTPSTEPRDGGH